MQHLIARIGQLALSLILVAGFNTPVFAGDDDHIFCIYHPVDISADNRAFYSAVFLGDYSFTTGYENDFLDHIKETYPGASVIESYCFFESDSRAAQRELERHARSTDIYEVVMTGWAPDNFANQPLQDFNMTISGDSAELEICVRDHECEDGDKVRVTAAGSRIFSGEIDNDWDCDEIRVSAGRDYAVELYAINGTGHKGACGHQDVNTGEIRVRGENTQTQSWRHRGGAGSSARIIVRAK